jgi:hypothetical protein
MDFWTWIASGFEQQQQHQDNAPSPTVTVAPLATDGELDLPDWSPSASDIPAAVSKDAGVEDAYKIFGAGLHDEFSEDNLALAFNAAYVASYSDPASVKFWQDEDGYIVVESDTMQGEYHVFRADPVTVYLDEPMREPADVPLSAPDDSGGTTGPVEDASASTPSPAASKQAKQPKATATKQAKPKTTTVKVTLTSAPTTASAPAAVAKSASSGATITSRSPLFRPWAQAASSNTLP